MLFKSAISMIYFKKHNSCNHSNNYDKIMKVDQNIYHFDLVDWKDFPRQS